MEENKPFCRDTALPGYLPLPRAILDRPLSATAMLLYGVLLDRGTLSQKNGYTSPGGQVYVIYTVEHLAQTLHRGTASVKVCLRELEKAGLIRRERSGWNRPSHIFLCLPEDGKPSVTQLENDPMEGWNTGWPWDRNEAPNDLSKQPDFISLYYQHSEEESL